MIFEMCKLILEQERFSNKKINWVCKVLNRNDIDTSLSFLKSWVAGGNTVDLERENKQYLNQLRAKKDNQMMNQWNPLNLCLAYGNDKYLLIISRRTSTFRSTKGNIFQRQSMI